MTENPTTAVARRVPANVRDVVVHDPFWAPRQEQLRARTLDAQYDQLVATGRLGALALTWTPESDEPKPHPFWESDIAKWLEAASYVLGTHPDPALEAKVDGVIAALAGAQREDGYLNVYFTVVAPGQRFTDLRDAHELYSAGHLIEAGVAHYSSTGRTTLLDVVTRLADLLCDEFGPGGAHHGGYCGHEEVELALVRLYRATGERRYLDLALTFVDARGRQPHYFDLEHDRRGTPGFFGEMFPQREGRRREFGEYNQSHAPVREQTEAVGHAVRAMYLYCAMADLAAETGDEGLRAACERLWTHLTTRRMYVTGGIGDSRHNEGFTRDHALPNETAYAETCAAIGLVFWARRMAGLTGQAAYIEILERALHNGVIAGVSADGQRFFYENPLASDGTVERADWFDCACCPPNLARLEASLGSYIYATAADAIAVDLFIGSTLTTDVAGSRVELRQDTSGPGGDRVDLTVRTAAPATWSLLVRAPSWSRSVSVRVNGERPDGGSAVDGNGYVALRREWADGDTVEVAFDVDVRRVHASTLVAADAGRVALTRGPFVYCVEGVDVDVPAHAVLLGETTPQPRATPSGVVPELAGPAWGESRGQADQDSLYFGERATRTELPLTAVPYYSWNNRGRSTMAVWLRES
ncbi:glycoside hydrolase family 127 protein [Occultella kanbiaonis]|uniref:glycoside hydrolase family 127 protein n=1 Tax=Occultella kanbiaonis TaxID=2675754 RepID=UPI0013D3C54F|nr:beta-L-arabinofuranosidase domain-containing protein [Occultella kanbiaonis]